MGDLDDEWQRAQRAGREASRAALLRRIKIGLPMAIAVGVGMAVPTITAIHDSERPPEPRPIALPAHPPSIHLKAGAFCSPGDMCDDGICVDARCRTGCEKGQTCPEGTACRSVDLDISLVDSEGKKTGKHKEDKGYLLCMPSP